MRGSVYSGSSCIDEQSLDRQQYQRLRRASACDFFDKKPWTNVFVVLLSVLLLFSGCCHSWILSPSKSLPHQQHQNQLQGRKHSLTGLHQRPEPKAKTVTSSFAVRSFSTVPVFMAQHDEQLPHYNTHMHSGDYSKSHTTSDLLAAKAVTNNGKKNNNNVINNQRQHSVSSPWNSRRDALKRLMVQGVAVVSGTAVATTTAFTTPAFAADDGVYQRDAKEFLYTFQPPVGFEPSNKPLKTHLDEVNFFFNGEGGCKGYQYGITVDPVRIQSLPDFGTPQEVAAKVVLAEVNRDGVEEVKLMEDPVQGGTTDGTGSAGVFYQLNYLSQGKRGPKRSVAKFYIVHQKLFALTAQCKEADYPELEQEILKAVDSFRIAR